MADTLLPPLLTHCRLLPSLPAHEASSTCRNDERGGVGQITRCPFVNFFQQRVQ
jgi:hypothetical protein